MLRLNYKLPENVTYYTPLDSQLPLTIATRIFQALKHPHPPVLSQAHLYISRFYQNEPRAAATQHRHHWRR